MIRIKDTGLPAGTIILSASMQPRYYEFIVSMEQLKVPDGTRWLLMRGCDITQNFNDGIKKSNGEWIWFMGDDHAFPDDMLLKLLKHNVDVVIPPTSCKTVPWLPCIMHGTGTLQEWKASMPLYTWEELSKPGLLALPLGDFIGQAGMLIKKSVLKDWGYPWFKAGQQDPGRLQEDMSFCRDLQQRGYTIWIDCDQILDHYCVMGITARKYEGQYVPALDNNRHIIVLPDALAVRMEDGTTKAIQTHYGSIKNPRTDHKLVPKSRIPNWLIDTDKLTSEELETLTCGGGKNDI